jgi:hypothetical protein
MASEKEFELLANAARRAQRDGANEEAVLLDKMARQMSSRLSWRKTRKMNPWGNSHPLPWQEIPSTLADPYHDSNRR